MKIELTHGESFYKVVPIARLSKTGEEGKALEVNGRLNIYKDGKLEYTTDLEKQDNNFIIDISEDDIMMFTPGDYKAEIEITHGKKKQKQSLDLSIAPYEQVDFFDSEENVNKDKEMKIYFQEPIDVAIDSFFSDKENVEKFIAPFIPVVEDGYTPQKGVDYEDGYTPIKGKDYFDGKDGETPKKGIDYFTNKEILEIKKAIKKSILEEMPEHATKEEVNIKFDDILKKIKNLPTGGGGALFLRQLMDVNVGNPTAQQYGLTYNPSRSEFSLTTIDSNVAWGQITGTLSNQTDLQSALDAKLESIVAGDNVTVDNTDPLNPIVSAATPALLTYMFTSIVSDIGATYLQAVSLNSYAVSTKSDQSGTATTSGVTIGRFATNLGFPNITLIPAGTITIHYDTEKGAGSNNYYTYAEIYKRNLAGTETLLATSDNSPQSAVNTQLSVTVTAILASDTSILSTDRIVVKVVAVMVSSTATIHVYGDDATSARIELPTAQIDATNYMTLATAQTATGAKTYTALGTYNTSLGTEKVTNGTPTSATGWTLGAAWSYSSSSFVKSIDGTTTVAQNISAVIGESYQVVYEVFNRTVGNITPTVGGVALTTRSADGTYTENVTATSTGNLIFTPTNTARLSIRLISVKKIADGGVLHTNTYPATLLYPSPISSPTWFHTTAWKSNATAAAQNVDFKTEARGFTGASIVTSEWALKGSINNATYSDLLKVSGTGKLTTTIISGVGETIGYEISAPFGNSTPGTTQHIKLSNSAQNSWITGYFSSVLKTGLGFVSDGTWQLHSANGLFNFYSSATVQTLIAQVYSGGFYNNFGNFNAGRLTAGSATVSPPATFTNYGSTALKTTVLTTDTTLDDSYTQPIVDCSSNNICIGTPTNACSTHADQTACELYTSHGGCVWNAGTSCSVYDNESGMASCAGQGGCTVVTSSCSGANNTDQSTCESQDDSYGGSCAWDTTTCPAFTSTSACNGQAGCSATVSSDCSALADFASCSAQTECTVNNGGDCNTLSDGGGDGTMCATQPQCSYDSGTGVCSGAYFTSCSGLYFTSCSGNLCNGTYNTGSCSGIFGAGCTGTPTCSGVGYTDCLSETGCSQSSGVTITMPASPVEQTYWIAKDYTSGSLTILPNSGHTINNTTSITSSATTGPSWMLTWVESKLNWYIMSKN